jgi:hypothetical protein
MCWVCGILQRILFNFEKNLGIVAGGKAPTLLVFLQVVLENVVCSGGIFVVNLWWIAW